jgi:hypothetical protein
MLYVSAVTTAVLMASFCALIGATRSHGEPPPVAQEPPSSPSAPSPAAAPPVPAIVAPAPKAAEELRRSALPVQEPAKAMKSLSVASQLSLPSPEPALPPQLPEWHYLVSVTGGPKVFRAKALGPEEAASSLTRDLGGSVTENLVAWTACGEGDADNLAGAIREAARPECSSCVNCSPSRAQFLTAGKVNWPAVEREAATLFKEARRLEEYHDPRLSRVAFDEMLRDLARLENEFTLNPASDPQAPRPERAVGYLLAVRKELAVARWLRESESPRRGLLPGLLVPPPRPAFVSAKSETQAPQGTVATERPGPQTSLPAAPRPATSRTVAEVGSPQWRRP